MGARLDFGKTYGVVKLLCVLLSPPCMMWLALKELGLQISRRFQGQRVAGTSGLKGTLMIGRWKWFKTSLVQWILGAAVPNLMISFGGKRQNLVPTL